MQDYLGVLRIVLIPGIAHGLVSMGERQSTIQKRFEALPVKENTRAADDSCQSLQSRPRLNS
jgi:hypothetical protein